MRNYTRKSWHCKESREVREDEYGTYMCKPWFLHKSKWERVTKDKGSMFYVDNLYCRVSDEPKEKK
jgi:hypothetical protein